MAFTQVVITQDFTSADGTEPSGTVTFTPTSVMFNGALAVPAVPVSARLDGQGTITITLYANTDSTTAPTGVAYQVVELINGVKRSYFIQVPHDQGGPLDLYSLVQLVAPPGLSFPGSLGNINSVTAANGTITVAGTSANPTIAVGTIAESNVTDLTTDLAAKLAKASNLSDLTSASTARTNLGLGGAAVLNVGAIAGTVAAGDDSRFSVPSSAILARLAAAPVTVTYAASITPNASLGCVFRVTATGDLTIADITGGVDGQPVTIEVLASGAARTVAVTGASVASVPSGSWWSATFHYNASADLWILG